MHDQTQKKNMNKANAQSIPVFSESNSAALQLIAALQSREAEVEQKRYIEPGRKSELSDTIQMRDDTAKIQPAAVGSDPTNPAIGLTCHHVIPAGMLERFYNLCVGITENKLQIKFNKWKNAAKKSTEETANIRDVLTYENYQASSAQWMAGNIFIGPIATMRIDDLHDENTFDYAVERKEYKNIKPDERKEKLKIEKLKEAFGCLTRLFNYDAGEQLRHTGLISQILNILIAVAADTATLHKQISNAATPAYNIKDWYSVGHPPIVGMEDKERDFQSFCQLYDTYQGRPRRSEKENEYLAVFTKYIHIQDLPRLGGQSWTIARHNFELLKQAYEKASA